MGTDLMYLQLGNWNFEQQCWVSTCEMYEKYGVDRSRLSKVIDEKGVTIKHGDNVIATFKRPTEYIVNLQKLRELPKKANQ